MNSIAYTSSSRHELTNKITEGLQKRLAALTNIDANNIEPQVIYAFHNDMFLGGVMYQLHRDILWIDSLWVEEKHRYKGVGEQLVKKIMLIAGQQGTHQIQLNTFFPEAHEFFLKCGFEDVTVAPDWKYGLQCYLMRKVLL